MSRLQIRPIKGVVLDPATKKPLPKGESTVVDSAYWRRRLRDGDVERVQPAGEPKKSAKKGTD